MRRAYRLRSPRDFRRVREGGKTWAHRLLVLGVAPNRSKRSRCGIVVSRSLGGAVQRNRLKRRVREAVRQIVPHIAPGWDLVFIVRAGVNTAEWDSLCEAVRSLLSRASVWQVQSAGKG